MKKGLILFVALTLITAIGAFAKVTAVKDGDAVKVTWTYSNADAGSVGLVGDFQGWKLADAVPLTKGADGVWTLTLTAKADSSYLYKFNVDGEWTEDPEAPAGVDDGFGGTNGKAVVADLISGNSGPKLGAQLATYTAIRTVSTFAKGAYKSNLVAGSYLKLGGLLTPTNPAYFEIAFLEGDVPLYDQTKGTDAGGVAGAFQGSEIGDFLFNPIYRLQNERYAYLGHFRLGFETPYVNITLYNKYAKLNVARDMFWSLYSGNTNSDQGLVEFTKELTVAQLPVTYYFGLSKESGLRGTLAYLQTTIAKQTIQVMFNTKEVTAADVKYFFGNINGQLAVSGKGSLGDGLKYNFGLVSGFYNPDLPTLTGAAKLDDAHTMGPDVSALGVKVAYSKDALSLALKTRLAGDYFSLGNFYGDNGDGDAFSKNDQVGKLFFDFDASYKLSDKLTLGLTTGDGFDNGLQNKTTVAAAQLSTNSIKPWVTYDNFGAYAKTNLNQQVVGTTDYSAFNFEEFGVSAALKNIAPDMNANAYLAFKNNNSWNGTDKAYQVDTSEISVIADTTLPMSMGAALGLIYRLDGKDTSSINTNDSRIGLSAEVTLKAGSIKWYAEYGWKSWLFDGEEGKGPIKSDSRFDNPAYNNSGADVGKLVVGAHIEF